MDNVKNAWKGIKYFIAVENRSLDIPELLSVVSSSKTKIKLQK